MSDDIHNNAEEIVETVEEEQQEALVENEEVLDEGNLEEMAHGKKKDDDEEEVKSGKISVTEGLHKCKDAPVSWSLIGFENYEDLEEYFATEVAISCIV